MAYDEYEEEEPVNLENKVEESLDNDEMDASEAAFIQGYNADEEKSFDGETEEDEE